MRSAPHEPLPIDPDPVGKWLADELDTREWSQADFASILGRPTQFVSEIINGKKEITRESAAQIGAALGQTAEMWLNLQDQYLLAEQAKNAHAQIEAQRRSQASADQQARPGRTAPQARRSCRRPRRRPCEEVMDLFDSKSLEDEPAFLAAARRANKDEVLSVLQTGLVRLRP